MLTGSIDAAAPDQSREALERDEQIATGQFLPATFTTEQVNTGKASYNTACASCHGNTLANGTMGPQLAGPNFEAKWKSATVAELYEATHTTMPPSRPGTLPDETYAAIVAYILRVNGSVPGEQPLLTDPESQANQFVIRPKSRTPRIRSARSSRIGPRRLRKHAAIGIERLPGDEIRRR